MAYTQMKTGHVKSCFLLQCKEKTQMKNSEKLHQMGEFTELQS